ncbi:hypothetical protein AZ78_2996 [Lysobacter capsici AZ78]|uniref:Uncharacterized protein n=1 Tax=Lysobacter capsici AZ78 TaxID=1444315 RepID=A0A108UAA1_9GAMM|nr:hypothetical protein AZ78_2996 [Lysobacter capsici AZ78]
MSGVAIKPRPGVLFARHPREGGDPGLHPGMTLKSLDPRLRGDDGHTQWPDAEARTDIDTHVDVEESNHRRRHKHEARQTAGFVSNQVDNDLSPCLCPCPR